MTNLPIRERVQGAEHPDTFSTRNHLALAYRAAGRVGDAIAIYEQLLPFGGSRCRESPNSRARAGRRAPRHAQHPQQPRSRLLRTSVRA